MYNYIYIHVHIIIFLLFSGSSWIVSRQAIVSRVLIFLVVWYGRDPSGGYVWLRNCYWLFLYVPHLKINIRNLYQWRAVGNRMDSLIIYGTKNPFLQNREPTCECIQSNSLPAASLVRSDIGVQKFNDWSKELWHVILPVFLSMKPY